MKRFEKIVLEQKIRKGNMGVRKIDGPLSSRTAKYFTNVDDLVTSFYYVDKHGKGKKYTPLTSNELVQRWLPTLFELQKYNTKDYIVILDTDSQVTDKTESVWDVFVVNRNSISKIPDSNIKKLGNVGSAPLISLIEFQRLKKQNELVAAKEKAAKEKAAAEAAKKAEAAKEAAKKAEQQRKVVANIVNSTEKINANNLGKGTKDAKAFQELLYQVGLKLIPNNKFFKRFAKYRTSTNGGWDGHIGVNTLNMLEKLTLKVRYKKDPADAIEALRNELKTKTDESINYFKGTGINVKLKDLLQEQLNIKSDDDVGSGGGNAGGGVRLTPKSKKTNFTPKTFPTNYTGKGEITYANGDTFEGSWVNGKKSGPGIYTSNDKTTYVGSWSNGKKKGEFTIKYSTGGKRVVTFVNNKIEGTATYTTSKGKSEDELWKNGSKIKTVQQSWEILKAWIDAEEEWWKAGSKSTGPAGQKAPTTKKQMFAGMNAPFDPDDVIGRAAYDANRKHALEWLESNLQSDIGKTWYSEASDWITRISDQIDDYFQNVVTVNITNDETGDTIYASVEPEMFD